jgi:hypothetical protein
MPLYQVTQRANGASSVIPLDLRRYSEGVGLLLTITGSLTATVHITGDNVQKEGYTPSSGNWNNHDTMINLTSSANGNLQFPVAALRLNVTSYMDGSAVLSVIQAEG